VKNKEFLYKEYKDLMEVRRGSKKNRNEVDSFSEIQQYSIDEMINLTKEDL